MEETVRSLPFTFAKQHGILLQDGETPRILHQAPLSVPLLAELRRYLGEPFALEEVGEEQFQRRLTQLYHPLGEDPVKGTTYRGFP